MDVGRYIPRESGEWDYSIFSQETLITPWAIRRRQAKWRLISRAVGEATTWLESLTLANGFRLDQLAERILLIEGAAVPQVRRLGREYLAMDTGTAGANALWEVAHRFWSLLASAHIHVLNSLDETRRSTKMRRSQLAIVYSAALNASAALMIEEMGAELDRNAVK